MAIAHYLKRSRRRDADDDGDDDDDDDETEPVLFGILAKQTHRGILQ
jgi:hypothetical protein